MNLILHPEKGVNPRLTVCVRCGKENGLILLGKWDRNFRCAACDTITIGAQRHKCDKCGGTRGEMEPIDDNARVPSGLCTECEAEVKEHAAIVAAGGVYWQCEDCKRSGVIKPSPFANDVRKQHGLTNGEPCGVAFNKESCPACNPVE